MLSSVMLFAAVRRISIRKRVKRENYYSLKDYALSRSSISFKIGYVNGRNTIWGESPTFSSFAHPHSFCDALNGNVLHSVTIAMLRSRYHSRLTFAVINHNNWETYSCKIICAWCRSHSKKYLRRALRGCANKSFCLMCRPLFYFSIFSSIFM